MINTIENKKINEKYYKIKHPTGLDIFVFPKPGFQKVHAIFATKYGSIDNKFKRSDKNSVVKVPDGIAHFLEHKMFESETEDAFERYARTGASANAYTSYDKTAYIFSATENIKESLEILLDFVQEPYFTKETVEKEQGIIAQEIRMCEDNPSGRVFVNLMAALYKKHPVNTFIAGTVESIGKIDYKLLYKCYETFYNLHNMALFVCGDVTVSDIMEVADKTLKPCEEFEIERFYGEDDGKVKRRVIQQELEVSKPLFIFGFKDKDTENKGKHFVKKWAESNILLEIISGKSSKFYKSLYQKELVNNSFSSEYFAGNGFGVALFGGCESKDPKKVKSLILSRINRLKKSGIKEEEFIKAKNLCYGRTIRYFNDVEDIADLMLDAEFMDADIFELVNAYDDIKIEDVLKRLEFLFRDDNYSLSIINPKSAVE